jgi:hypothetical protein
MDNDGEQFARFEEMGEEAVRILAYTAGFATTNQRLAIKWLAQKDQESERRRDASQAEQIDLARSANDAAWEAARNRYHCGSDSNSCYNHVDLRLDLSAPLGTPGLAFWLAFVLRLPSFIVE